MVDIVWTFSLRKVKAKIERDIDIILIHLRSNELRDNQHATYGIATHKQYKQLHSYLASWIAIWNEQFKATVINHNSFYRMYSRLEFRTLSWDSWIFISSLLTFEKVKISDRQHWFMALAEDKTFWLPDYSTRPIR